MHGPCFSSSAIVRVSVLHGGPRTVLCPMWPGGATRLSTPLYLSTPFPISLTLRPDLESQPQVPFVLCAFHLDQSLSVLMAHELNVLSLLSLLTLVLQQSEFKCNPHPAKTSPNESESQRKKQKKAQVEALRRPNSST